MKSSTISEAVVCPYEIRGHIFRGGIKNSPDYGRIMRRTGEFADEWYDSYGNKNGELRLEGRYLYAGPFYNHFGHIMTESIHRLFAFDDSYDGVIFCSAGYTNKTVLTQEVPNYFLEIINYFGINEEKLIILRETTTIETLDVFECGSRLQHGAIDEYLDRLKEIRKKNSLAVNDSFPKKVFFGRSHIIDSGTVLGESYFMSNLLDNGFTYIAPEKFSVSQQVCILENAEEVVFMEGSAIYALELLPSITANVYMIPRRPYDSFFRPHVEGKAFFGLLGNLNSMIRIGNMDGLVRPNSPTICLMPDVVHDAMINYNLINDVEFSRSSFISFVKYDLLRYAGRDSNRYNEMLDEVELHYQR
ncbi:glycosyltransferase 61 family protein [Psychromonas sp.]|uniref:glycosyltransferase 61 family protein n=1 Tax=Psychromonas sp. TaxID=1884585 RepID=UPI003A96BC1F